MPTVSSQIEIAAPPEAVRKQFLDFASFPQWSHKAFQSVEVLEGDRNNLKAGDKLKVTLPSMKFPSTVIVSITRPS